MYLWWICGFLLFPFTANFRGYLANENRVHTSIENRQQTTEAHNIQSKIS